jgi:NADPH-dependent 2,4-dienoyl-CoA reductase/sulfur reductase-like enzyme
MSQSLVDRYDDRIAGILSCYDPVVITDRDTRKVGTVNLATDIQPVPQGDLAPTRSAGRHHVVIVGGGFGGLEAANGLAGAPVDITVIDQRNHHIFQPLLYQVATASLAPSEIAWPIRFLMRGRPECVSACNFDPLSRGIGVQD